MGEKKGTSIETNTKKIKPRDNACMCDQKSSIFPTELVVTGGYFIMGIKGSETFQICITSFVCFQIHLTE